MKQKSAPARMSTQARKYTMYGIIFALPWMLGFLMFTVYPIIASIVYSFTDFNGFAIKEFVGVQNYVQFFTDEKSLKSLWNTLYMCVFSLPANIVFSLCMALLLSLNVKGPVSYTHLRFLYRQSNFLFFQRRRVSNFSQCYSHCPKCPGGRQQMAVYHH